MDGLIDGLALSVLLRVQRRLAARLAMLLTARLPSSLHGLLIAFTSFDCLLAAGVEEPELFLQGSDMETHYRS